MRVEHARQVRLRVEIDAERPLPALRDPGEKVETGRGLADAAFLVEDRDDRHEPSLQAPRPRNPGAGRRRGRSAIIRASMNRALQIAILAAGEGKRMRSALPKVLHLLGGKPLLAHVLETARRLEPRSICVVYGATMKCGGDLPRTDLVWARQDPPRGTGDALRCALAAMPGGEMTLVLFGADPMARAATLQQVVDHAQRGALSLLTVGLRRSFRLRTHRARRRRQSHRHRRAEGCVARAACDPRDQHRRDGRAYRQASRAGSQCSTRATRAANTT